MNTHSVKIEDASDTADGDGDIVPNDNARSIRNDATNNDNEDDDKGKIKKIKTTINSSRKSGRRRSQNKKEAKQYQCENCNYSTDSKQHIGTHRVRHTGERPFDCKICGKTFNRKDSLTRHTRRCHRNGS